MTDKEKIRAEIERMMSEEKAFFEDNCKHGNAESSSSAVVYTRLQMLLKRIDSLPEEKESEDLLIAARRAAVDKPDTPLEFLDERPYSPRDEYKFIEGANWQKQQMMKDAVSAVVTENYGLAKIDGEWKRVGQNQVMVFPNNVAEGDKVKVIIIKEEQISPWLSSQGPVPVESR